MIYMIPTKRGIGVELWGTFDDLECLYDVISKFWNKEDFQRLKGFDNRDTLISGFSYEIRHAFQEDRLKSNIHQSAVRSLYLGTRFSWPHILFSLSALKYNMRFIESDKLDISIFLQLDYWIEKSLNDFDPVGAKALLPYVNGAIYSANECLYQYMRSINAEYFMLGGGKKAFRELPKLLERSVYASKSYSEYSTFLTKEAQRLQCKIDNLELSDDDLDYDGIAW